MVIRRSRDGLWRKRLRAVARAWPAAVAGAPEGVHQLRVASRRVQEALVLASRGRRPRRVKRARRQMRRLRRALGPVRERDVSLALLAGIETVHPELHPGIEPVRLAVQDERERARVKAREFLEARAPEALLRKTARAGAERGDEEAGGHEAAGAAAAWQVRLAARVVRRARQLQQAVEHAGALYAAERLHAVRVAAKKLRYALELGHDAQLWRWGAAVRRLKQLQDTLGAVQDRETLLDHVRSIPASDDPAAEAALEGLTRLLEEETRRGHARFLGRRSRLLTLCARVRRQASEILPVGRAASHSPVAVAAEAVVEETAQEPPRPARASGR